MKIEKTIQLVLSFIFIIFSIMMIFDETILLNKFFSDQVETIYPYNVVFGVVSSFIWTFIFIKNWKILKTKSS
jgi:hypothetical protein